MKLDSAQRHLAEIARQLDALHDSAQRGELSAAIEGLENAERELASLVRGAPDRAVREALFDDLSDIVDRFEDDARSALEETEPPEGDDADTRARVAATLRVRALALRRLAREIERPPHIDEVSLATAELEHASESTGSGPRERGHRERIAGIRTALDTARAVRCLDAADTLLSNRRIDTSFAMRLLRETERCREGLGGDAPAEVSNEDLDRVRARLLQAVLPDPSGAHSAEARGATLRHASLVIGALDEARMRALERDDETNSTGNASLLSLDRSIADGSAFRDALEAFRAGLPESVTEAERSRFRRAVHRLDRMLRRLRDVRSDRILRSRVRKLFGRSIVRIWEATVFWLIVVALSLIVVEHYGRIEATSEPGSLPWTVLVDTGICGALLLDFFVRLALTPRRLRFFFRNALTDLLPALPVGLLTSLAATPEVRSVWKGSPLKST